MKIDYSGRSPGKIFKALMVIITVVAILAVLAFSAAVDGNIDADYSTGPPGMMEEFSPSFELIPAGDSSTSPLMLVIIGLAAAVAIEAAGAKNYYIAGSAKGLRAHVASFEHVLVRRLNALFAIANRLFYSNSFGTGPLGLGAKPAYSKLE